MSDKYEAWLEGLLAKRTPDALAIMGDLIKAGLRKGHCSANDITHRDVEQPNIIGGVFMVIKRMGFRQTDRREEAAHKSQNGRKVFVWELEEPSRAKLFLRKWSEMAFGIASRNQAQGELF